MQDWFYVKKTLTLQYIKIRYQKAELNIASRASCFVFMRTCHNCIRSWAPFSVAVVSSFFLFYDLVNLFCVCVCVMVLRRWKRISSSCFIFFRVTGCGHTDFNRSIFNDWTRNQRQRGGNNKPLSLEKRHVKYLEFHTLFLVFFYHSIKYKICNSV